MAQNGLGFKTGQYVLQSFKEACTTDGAFRVYVEKINLEFNVMSESLNKRIQDTLNELNDMKNGGGRHQSSAKKYIKKKKLVMNKLDNCANIVSKSPHNLLKRSQSPYAYHTNMKCLLNDNSSRNDLTMDGTLHS